MREAMARFEHFHANAETPRLRIERAGILSEAQRSHVQMTVLRGYGRMS